MPLEHHTHNGVECVRLPRRLLMADAKASKKFLNGLLKHERPRLVIDMSAVEHIDSSGLAVLVNVLQNSRKRSGDVCLFGLSETVVALFELTRLHQVFPIEDRFEEAVQRMVA